MFLVRAYMPGLLALSSGHAITEEARSAVARSFRASSLGYGVYIYLLTGWLAG